MDEWSMIEAFAVLSTRPAEQLEALERLLIHLDDEDLDVEGWATCNNGCCLKLWVEGFDETSWGVTRAGDIIKNDRYGNITEMEI